MRFSKGRREKTICSFANYFQDCKLRLLPTPPPVALPASNHEPAREAGPVFQVGVKETPGGRFIEK
jgi:hypothetical protein